MAVVPHTLKVSPKKPPRDSARCMVAQCERYTAHKSGVCAEHRTFLCLSCGKLYTLHWHQERGVETKLCANCKRLNKNIQGVRYG